MAANLYFVPFRPAYDSAGISVPGSQHYFTLTGTNTPSAPYADAAMTTPLSNPVVADGAGKIPPVYLNDAITYRVRIYDRDAEAGVDTPLEEYDPYIPGALQEGAISTTEGVAVSSRGLLAAIVAPVDGQQAWLTEAGREGGFTFESSNLAARVAADTQQGLYVAPSTDTSGASGAWVRTYSGPANVSWFGAALDDATNDATAIAAALAVAGDVEVPAGKIMRIASGAIALPTGCTLRVNGDIRYTGSAQYVFRALGSVGDITILGPGALLSAVDVSFLHWFRLEQAAGQTLDGFRVSGGLKVTYTDIVHTGGNDRWFVAGNGQGTRQNVIIEDVILTGWMQLTASMASNGTFKNSEIRRNRIHNAGANPISISCTGGIGAGNVGRAENIRIVGNTITADSSGHSSVGIFIGVDGSGNDQVGQVQDIYIGDNYVNIAPSPVVTTDLLIRLGNDASNLANGYLSTADKIVVHNNRFNSGILIDQPAITSANALTKATNFHFTNNKIYGGDLIFAHMDGATLQGNVAIDGCFLRPGPNIGTIESAHNTWTKFIANSSSNSFTWNSRHDEFFGSSAASSDRTITLNAATPAIQTMNLVACAVNSRSASPFSGVRTTGTGTNTVTVRQVYTSTAWSSDLYEVVGGTITDKTGQTTRTLASTSALTPKTSETEVIVTALAANMTLNAPTGATPENGKRLLVRIKDNGSSKTLTYNAVYRAFGTALPTATTISKTLYLEFVYNAEEAKWDALRVATES